MSALTPALDAALSGPRPLIFGAMHIALPEYDLRLLDGAAQLTWGGHTYLGRDPIYGTISGIDLITDGYGDEAPGLTITLSPTDDATAAELSSPEFQGSKVFLWIGAVIPATGAVVADPFLVFQGELDVPRLRIGQNTRSLTYDCVSGFERFFEVIEGIMLSDAFHKSVWPGELGLSNMTGIQRTTYWGAEQPPPVGGTYTQYPDYLRKIFGNKVPASS